LNQAKPNKGHRCVARLVEAGKVSVVITQNIDNLHQDSGVPDEKLIELHGNASYARCLSCKQRHELSELKQQFLRDGNVSPCTACGGLVKTATISFGQPMPEEAMVRATRETMSCDLFIVLGSSLSIYPAAGLPELAKTNNAQLVIVNQQETPLDDLADLVISRKIGHVMQDVCKHLAADT